MTQEASLSLPSRIEADSALKTWHDPVITEMIIMVLCKYEMIDNK